MVGFDLHNDANGFERLACSIKLKLSSTGDKHVNITGSSVVISLLNNNIQKGPSAS